jgi:hypothetical protein
MAALFRVIDEIDTKDELCQLFVAPPRDGWDVETRLRTALSGLQTLLHGHAHQCSQTVIEYTLETAVARIREVSSKGSRLSYSIGTVLGRWNNDAVAGLDLPGPLDEIGRRSPGESQHALSQDAGSEWLTDDEGARSDVAAAVRAFQESVWGPGEDDAERIRAFLRKDFFIEHLAHYSKSARKAPVYWQLASATAKYSAWVYYHRLSRDSLFRLLNDHATPKLRHEEQKLEALRAACGNPSSMSERKELAGQEVFVGELRDFVEELGRVAPLWEPNFDDGVIINFAPVWRLVPQNKAWQRGLKCTWDGLCEGKYDWAHIAMRLWPERVVPKCSKDRSLAIAHGLEDVFWVEVTDGKWTARKTPTRSVDELVRERTSPAVKSALKSLLEAPAGAAKSGGRRAGGRRKSAAAAEGGDA